MCIRMRDQVYQHDRPKLSAKRLFPPSGFTRLCKNSSRKKGTPRDADLPVSSGKTSMAGLEIAILGNDQWIDTKLNHNTHLAMLKG